MERVIGGYGFPLSRYYFLSSGPHPSPGPPRICSPTAVLGVLTLPWGSQEGLTPRTVHVWRAEPLPQSYAGPQTPISLGAVIGLEKSVWSKVVGLILKRGTVKNVLPAAHTC